VPDQILRDGNRILIHGRLTERAALRAIATLNDAITRGYTELTLEFSACSRAWPEGMVPIICQVQALREEGNEFLLELPRDETLRRLFLNTNWAHLVAPQQFEAYDFRTRQHLPATRYDATSQKAIVDRIVEIVVGSMEIERPVLAGLEWSVNEITDNVLVHAESPAGGLVQVMTQRDARRVSFVVGDAGIGVLASMREGYPALRDDVEAIGEAVKAGVTRDPKIGQGNGLAGTLRIVSMSQGSFSVLSGRGLLDVYPDRATGSHGDHISTLPAQEYYTGTVVSAEFDSSAPLRLEDALGFQSPDWEPFDYIDARHTALDGRALIVTLRDETAGFGSRIAGAQLRMKCLNLLRDDPPMPLVLDWEGVPLISSSFADEAVGKLFVELGPIVFGERVHCVNVEPLVRLLIDKAIIQRVAQHAAE